MRCVTRSCRWATSNKTAVGAETDNEPGLRCERYSVQRRGVPARSCRRDVTKAGFEVPTLVSVCCKPSLFNSHVLVMLAHIYMNVNKLGLNQLPALIGGGGLRCDCRRRGTCVRRCAERIGCGTMTGGSHYQKRVLAYSLLQDCSFDVVQFGE